MSDFHVMCPHTPQTSHVCYDSSIAHRDSFFFTWAMTHSHVFALSAQVAPWHTLNFTSKSTAVYIHICTYEFIHNYFIHTYTKKDITSKSTKLYMYISVLHVCMLIHIYAHAHICILELYTYICAYKERKRELSLSLSIMYTCICIYVCIICRYLQTKEPIYKYA